MKAKIIRGETGTYIEIPRNRITFKSKEAEIIFDLTLENDELRLKNQELKKQLEEYKRLGFKHLNDKCNKLENQQKEFIEYINEKIDICDGFIDTVRSDLEEISYGGRITGKTYIANEIMKNEVAKKCFSEILSKYKEIIGGK